MDYKLFFSELGFDFKDDLESRTLIFDKNDALTEALNNCVFFYDSPNKTNTSFYLITTTLSAKDIEELRRYVWNKNDADLIFYYPKEGAKLVMFYAKYAPNITNEESRLDSFSTTQNDTDKIKNIKHWQFDSGVFWLNYSKFIDKSKYKGIDKELVFTLETLKKQLDNSLLQLIPEETKRNENVQALIDRTLYIKYLEDNHIINSHFYGHYFNDTTLNYKKLLENNSDADLNKLFKKIHEIFNNTLFERPTIDNEYLTKDTRLLIANSFNINLNTGQLKLFHFQFDVLPVEFISYIYEVFLSDKQKENGIYYTPKKLAQLIIDEVINEDKIGSILDPSSGSGMFLIIGYQRLLEIARKKGLEPNNSLDKIRFRTKLLSDNIFGIEKQLTARRFTLFSLSLQIFKGINPEDIKNFIANELEQNKKINLFSEFSIFENIKHANTLDLKSKSFANKKFAYLVGNPPFFEIPDNDEFNTEISFLKSFKVELNKEEETTAKEIVGKSQISQCFFLKIKDWADKDTRFGFVSNSSNFYNDYSEKFQKYFYSIYGIEKIYELSRVKKILFEKAKESVVALIFTNKYTNNTIDYYPVELGLFSEKPFELLIIQEDKVVPISQKQLVSNELSLRDFLIGNELDRNLLNTIRNESIELNTFLNQEQSNYRGLERIENKRLAKFYNIDIGEYNNLSRKEKNYYHLKFSNERYLTSQIVPDVSIPYLYSAKNITPFRVYNDLFIKLSEINKTNFRRCGALDLFDVEKILLNRFGGRINAIFSNYSIAFSTYIFCLILNDTKLYYFITAFLNSKLCNYYLHISDRKRVNANFSNIDLQIIKNIPISKDLEQDLLKQISDLSKKLTEGIYLYSEKESELNELIYELYELSYWEKQRIEDYFLSDKEKRIGRKKTALNKYKTTLNELLSFYLKHPITVEEAPTDFGLKVIKLSLNQKSNTPKASKTAKFLLNEIFEQNPNENFLASQEKIYGKDCVYIIKEDKYKNWTETKAFEDSQDLLKHLIPNGNG